MVEVWTEETDKLLDDLGIPEEEKAYWVEEMREWGEQAYYEGNAEGLKNMAELFGMAGWVDEYRNMLNQYFGSIGYYETKSGGVIYWDDSVERWRNAETGKFEKNPYAPLWSMI